MDAGAGNPLALIELHGVLTEEQRRGTEAVSEPLPPGVTLQRMFERRVSRLPKATRESLLVAAASFTPALEPVLAACAALGIDSGALEPAEVEGIVRISTERIEFGHPLLRGAVYQSANPPERRRAHRALSEHTDADSRSWHLATATIEPDTAVADELEATARRASERGAYTAAADALERASRLSEDAEARSRRLLAAGVAAATGGAYERGVALMELAKEIDDPSTRAAVRHRLGLATLNGGLGNSGDTYAMLTEEAERIAPIDPAAAAAIYADAGVAAAIAGNCPLVLESAERAADVLPPDADTPTRGQVHSILGHGLILRGRTAEGRDNLDVAGRLLAEIDPLSVAAQTIAFALGSRRCTGQERLLREEAESLERAAREAGAGGLFPYYGVLVADGAFRSGDWEATERGIAEAVEGAQESGQLASLAIALAVAARLHAAKGDEELARAEVARATEISERPGYGNPVVWGKAALAGLALAQGRVTDAIEDLELVQRLLEVGGLEDPLVVPWAPDLVEAYAAAGRMQDAARIAGIIGAQADRNGTPLAAALAAHCDGVVAEDSFAPAFERALDLHEEGEWPFERARTLLAFGARLHRARLRTEARERLRTALESFERLGANAWVERTNSELRAAGAVRRDPISDPDELTAQEVRVALAVARGATNREVAEELFLSPKTIEFHLGRVYRKLGIHSRTELAALAAEGRLEPGRSLGPTAKDAA